GFRVTSETSAFRAQEYEPPVSSSFSAPPGSPPFRTTNQVAPSPSQNAQQAATQALVDTFRAKAEARKPVIVPIQVSFPEVGPSMYLVSELTGENKSPT